MLRYSVPVTLLDLPPPKIANPILTGGRVRLTHQNTVNSVANPERFEADPDFTFYFDADYDQNFT